ncbi:MAG: NADH peroxidase [Planctomycetes bacterium RIFCSPHIGHO2_02_FULL_50_42]|nr:MAG: NADH peroxidase [Planctomycetes bacterium RIFCSPHIGHO2_02_FULL_50_42]OHB96657.1 MAG: NADH peroxidase [Planctomycetes bacterium RIFCSPLOWO2_02_FULL_50_16]OHC02865.1 MAG: NADH peroxidase [Planctomycetes bacterium RIFCSPLOWO2_12_FULL_50_35]HCN20059.1 NADH peroxidase [Planctomycetia bacterium]
MSRLLFTPININTLTLPNRFVRSATNEYMTDENDFVTDRLASLYEKLARGGVGLIITGHSYVRKDGKASKRQAAIYDDKFIPAYKRLVERLRPFDTKIMLQITHGGRQTKPEICDDTPIAPSPITDKSTGVTPREMIHDDILDVINCFGQAARRAKEAGFGGIQIHAAHGYLLSEFLSPYTNRRDDEWGGTVKNRARILLEVLKACRLQTGMDYPIFVKLQTDDCVEGGLGVEDAVETAKMLEKEGIDAIETSGGIAESFPSACREGIDSPDKEGYFASNAERIKKAVSVPVIVVGGIRSIGVMESIIEEKKADLISMSRPFIREPDLIDKLRTGRATKSECISCNQCWHPDGIRCTQISKQPQ